MMLFNVYERGYIASTKDTDCETSTSSPCHVLNIGWFLPVVALPCDLGTLKITWIDAVPLLVPFGGSDLYKLGINVYIKR